MRNRRLRAGTTVVAAVLVPLLGLSACGSDDKDDDKSSTSDSPAQPSSDEPTDETSVSPSETPSEEPSEATTEEAGSTGSLPSWALPVTKPGDLLTTAEVGDVTVAVYQVGHEKATDDGNFVDPDTNKPILKKGDDLIFVNYVITNNGDPIDLGSSRVSISARYDDWKWMQGMDSDTDDSVFESQGVNQDDLGPDGYNERGIYTFGTGETYSFGENFAYQKNSPITFDVTITPVDAEGELQHDLKSEGEIKTTIK
ncbi:hypothetical protein [Nocardioides sp. Soil796]|uniref:hypothetical protein n=1 Tax=Nocardioides sp. Soil796 TaxID=1736412 RepID=UPI00070A16C0|nr:hypothetical protein [Nocardioides sp. Soil796]KRF12923.1 hypothetical protein ASH02_15540 [Nocardioides sp. Soil796]